MEFMTPEGHTNFHAKILFDCKEEAAPVKCSGELWHI